MLTLWFGQMGSMVMFFLFTQFADVAISFVSMALHFPRRENLLTASYKDPSYGAKF